MSTTRGRAAATWFLAPVSACLLLTGCGNSTGGNPTAATPVSGSTAGSTTAELPRAASIAIGSAQEIVDADVTTRITVDSLVPAQASQYGMPASGDLQQITVVLEGVSGVTNVNPLYFSARAADGTAYQSALGTVDGQLPTGTLSAGDILKGVVAFDVTGPPIASIRYNDALGGELAKWDGQLSGPPAASNLPNTSTGPGRGDLGLSTTPMSIPSCDGTGIVVLYSATNPATYGQEIAAQLLKNPGASYLRTDSACPSLRQATEEGNPIYAVYRVAGQSQTDVCAAVATSGGGSYGKWLDRTTDPGYIIPC